MEYIYLHEYSNGYNCARIRFWKTSFVPCLMKEENIKSNLNKLNPLKKYIPISFIEYKDITGSIEIDSKSNIRYIKVSYKSLCKQLNIDVNKIEKNFFQNLKLELFYNEQLEQFNSYFFNL